MALSAAFLDFFRGYKKLERFVAGIVLGSVQAGGDLAELVGVGGVPEVPGHQGGGDVPAGRCDNHVTESDLTEEVLVVVAE